AGERAARRRLVAGRNPRPPQHQAARELRGEGRGADDGAARGADRRPLRAGGGAHPFGEGAAGGASGAGRVLRLLPGPALPAPLRVVPRDGQRIEDVGCRRGALGAEAMIGAGRVFTIEEVNGLIPSLSRLVEKQLLLQSEIEQQLAELSRLRPHGDRWRAGDDEGTAGTRRR